MVAKALLLLLQKQENRTIIRSKTHNKKITASLSRSCYVSIIIMIFSHLVGQVKRRRLELPRHNWHYPLKVARLPIPPPLRSQKLRIQNRIPVVSKCWAENGTRTRDPNLGKVVLYQLSYFRLFPNFHRSVPLNAVAKVLHFSEPTKFFSDFFSKKVLFPSFLGKNRHF